MNKLKTIILVLAALFISISSAKEVNTIESVLDAKTSRPCPPFCIQPEVPKWIEQRNKSEAMHIEEKMEKFRVFKKRSELCIAKQTNKVTPLNPKHLLKIKTLNQCEKCELNGAILSGLELDYANLQDASLICAIFDDSKFFRTKFNDATLKDASFRNTKSNNVNSGTRFDFGNLFDFTDSDLKGSDFTNSDLYESNFTNADLTNANLSGVTTIRDAKMEGAIFCNTKTPWGVDNKDCKQPSDAYSAKTSRPCGPFDYYITIDDCLAREAKQENTIKKFTLNEQLSFLDSTVNKPVGITNGVLEVAGIFRNQFNNNTVDPDFAKTSRPCPPFCIQPTNPFEPKEIDMVTELDVIYAARDIASGDNTKVVIDARTPGWLRKGTIPHSVNVPFTKLNFKALAKNPMAVVELMVNTFGVKDMDGVLNYDNAKTLYVFSNGSWCGQSIAFIKGLLKVGYPEEKIKHYRGGMQDWHLLGLSMKNEK